MIFAKIRLDDFSIVEHPSVFPYQGALAGRTDADRAAILDDPAAFFGDPVEVPTVVGREDIVETVPTNGGGTVNMVVGQRDVMGTILSDPCPDGARGFAWWPVVDQSTNLGLLETYGEPVLTVDQAGRRVTSVAPVIAPTADALTAFHDSLERDLHRQIDEAAEGRRLDFITPGAGQSATYDAKSREASVIVAGATPTEADHPFVWREAQALGKTASDRAAEIVATAAAWIAVGSVIEATRQGAKAAVTAAKGDKTAMETAAAVDWTAIGGA